ncbi:MAG: tetratricopeptide repeat protein [Bacteroidota bacterium]|nr:tetratricopeptide repeat protein [Bacteroidota bacterium]
MTVHGKKGPIAVVFLFLPLSMCGAGGFDLDRSWGEAASAYHAGDYGHAVEIYEHILANGFASPALYYNLGNAYYRRGELGKSILCYRRALVLQPSSQYIRDNLALAEMRVKDRVEPIPLLFIIRKWNELKETSTVWALAVGACFPLWLLMAAVFVFFGFERVVLRRVALFGGCISFLFLAASLFLLFDKMEDLSARRTAVILAREAPLRVSPEMGAPQQFLVHEGLTVEVLEQKGNWLHVRLADGTKGWLLADSLERV